jgi:hypothetical protein
VGVMYPTIENGLKKTDNQCHVPLLLKKEAHLFVSSVGLTAYGCMNGEQV